KQPPHSVSKPDRLTPDTITSKRPRREGSQNTAAVCYFVETLLQNNSISYETANGTLEAMMKLHKSHHNILILAGNLRGKQLRREIRERVWGGEGLIIFYDKASGAPHWTRILGVRSKSVPAAQREKFIRVKGSVFGGAGEIVLAEKSKYRLELKADDVQVLAETAAAKHPLVTYRKYGRGDILVVAMPLNIAEGSACLAQVLTGAAALFSRDVYANAGLTRHLPVEITLKNTDTASGPGKLVTVKEILPYGVEAYGFTPEPLPAEPGTTGQLTWDITVDGSNPVKINYWLRLPDQVDTYNITSEIYENERKSEELELTLEVASTVESCLDGLIMELQALDIPGRDKRFVGKAIKRLRHLQIILAGQTGSGAGQTGSGSGQFLQLIHGLYDTIAAADALNNAGSADIPRQRLKVGAIMRILGRRIYDKVTQWGCSRLSPFIRLIEAE
ncbi:MAG: hypothetical protein GY757_18620, partial [bacterium]|nr:hypothetical protein [bacterium]